MIEDEIKRIKDVIYEESAKLGTIASGLQKGICLILSKLMSREVVCIYNDDNQEYEYGYYNDEGKFTLI